MIDDIAVFNITAHIYAAADYFRHMIRQDIRHC